MHEDMIAVFCAISDSIYSEAVSACLGFRRIGGTSK